MLIVGRSRVRDQGVSIFSNYPIFTASLVSEVQPASKINKYQKQKNILMGSKARPVHRADKASLLLLLMP
jgi:hypothetical protein